MDGRNKPPAGRVGVSFGYHPCGQKCWELANGSGEYLFDLAWFEYKDDGGMTSMPLVLECEWGKEDEVDYDFQKLLVAHAAHKVMIMQGNEPERHFARLSQLVANSAIAPAGDRYLFLLWHWDELKLRSYLFVKRDDAAQEEQVSLAPIPSAQEPTYTPASWSMNFVNHPPRGS